MFYFKGGYIIASCCAYQYLIFYFNKTSYEKPAVKFSSLEISIITLSHHDQRYFSRVITNIGLWTVGWTIG